MNRPLNVWVVKLTPYNDQEFTDKRAKEIINATDNLLVEALINVKEQLYKQFGQDRPSLEIS